MAWYSTGTVSVTNGSTTVTGSGTNFTSGARAGEAFYGPDGKLYEVGSVVSSTQLTLNTAYLGSTATGQSYSIIPTQGLVANLATQVSNLITDFQDVADLAGEGKFGDGTVSAPGIRFNNDQDTGFFRETGNEIAIATGGIKQAEVNSAGINIPDSKKITFGDSNDLEITHDGSHTYIKETNSTGSLRIWAKDFELYNADGTENIINADADGGIQLYHNNIQKVNVTSTGLDVTGTLSADGLTVDTATGSASPTPSKMTIATSTSASDWSTTLPWGRLAFYSADASAGGAKEEVTLDVIAAQTAGGVSDFTINTYNSGAKQRLRVSYDGDISFYEDTGTTAKLTWDASAESLNFADNAKAIFGAGSDLQIYSDGVNSVIHETDGTGNLIVKASNINLQNSGGTSTLAQFIDGGKSSLRYSGSEKLATTASGVDVTGTVTADGLTVDGAASVNSNSLTLTGGAPIFKITDSDTNVDHTLSGASGVGNFALSVDANNEGTSPKYIIYIGGTEVFRIEEGGDISFYEDTGTTPKLFWDASAEQLNLGGPTSANAPLNLESDANNKAISIEENGAGTETWQIGVDLNGNLHFYDSNSATPSITFEDGGNVGIGTSSPLRGLDVRTAVSSFGNTFFVDTTAGTAGTGGGIIFGSDDGLGTDVSVAAIQGIKENSTAGNQQGALLFATKNSVATQVERMRIDSAGNVGIGTSSPSTNLEISDSSAAIMRLTDSGSSAYSQLRADAGTLQLDANAGNASVTEYISMRIAGSEAARIDASGNLLVGQSSTTTVDTSSSVTGYSFLSVGRLGITRNEGVAVALNRLSTDGPIAEFKKDGTAVGSIGTTTDNSRFRCLDASNRGFSIRTADGETALEPSTTTAQDGYGSLGTSGARWKDLYLSGGVYLGGTGAANKLDDYEEGTWTPAANAYSGVMTVNEAVYRKVGDLVMIRCAVTFDGTADGSSVIITGLPFSNNSSGSGGYVSNDASGSTTSVRYQSSTSVAVTDGQNFVSYTTVGANALALTYFYLAS